MPVTIAAWRIRRVLSEASTHGTTLTSWYVPDWWPWQV